MLCKVYKHLCVCPSGPTRLTQKKGGKAVSGLKGICLRVVQTQAILFLKSMSESGGSDIERYSEIALNSVSDATLSDINFRNKVTLV